MCESPYGDAMPTSSGRRTGRQRGSVEELPSGALRVSGCAGRDLLTGCRHYLREVIPAGPSARGAQKAMRLLANQVDERRKSEDERDRRPVARSALGARRGGGEHPRQLPQSRRQAHPSADRFGEGRRARRRPVRFVSTPSCGAARTTATADSESTTARTARISATSGASRMSIGLVERNIRYIHFIVSGA